MSRATLVGRSLRGGVVVAMLVAAGCSGGHGFGESITVPPEQHTKVGDAFAAGKTLRLPAEVRFNVADVQRFSRGAATAEASADASGTAGCSAKAQADGSAWAEFQLGQVVANRGDQPLAVTVTFNVSYSYRTSGQVSAGGATPDQFALKVYISDSDRRSLKRMMLAELDPAKGPTTWTGTQAPAFDVTLEPGLAYHLVLAGRVEVSGDETRSPAAEIDVQSLEVSIVPKS